MVGKAQQSYPLPSVAVTNVSQIQHSQTLWFLSIFFSSRLPLLLQAKEGDKEQEGAKEAVSLL